MFKIDDLYQFCVLKSIQRMQESRSKYDSDRKKGNEEDEDDVRRKEERRKRREKEKRRRERREDEREVNYQNPEPGTKPKITPP